MCKHLQLLAGALLLKASAKLGPFLVKIVEMENFEKESLTVTEMWEYKQKNSITILR